MVFQALKEDSRKGDFVAFTNMDREELEICLNNTDIKDMPQRKWKAIVETKVKETAFQSLLEENSMKDKTRTVSFTELKMTEYLNENKRTSLLKLIFSMRSKTLDIKD